MGAQRDVLAGDVRGHVALDDLATLPHLYAVGPLEGVRGEVTIIDGHAWIARVLEGMIQVEESFGHRACFLVWAQVEEWTTVPLVAVESEAALEVLVLAAARKRGLGGGQPLVFLLDGVGSARIHVLDKRDAVRHDAEQHERAKVRVTVDDAAMQIVGFHSTCHRGVFTPKDSDLHMHVRTVDGRLAGHVETLRLRAGGLLRLPRVAKEMNMKISARNKLKGRIAEVVKGATTAHVKIDIGGGAVITASITNEAVDEMGLKAGEAAYAVIKATDVMVGKD